MALHFSKEEFSNRKRNVLKSMKEQNLNALLMFKQESMYWLTGYDTFGFVFFQSLILRDDGEIILLTRAPDLRQAQNTSNIKAMLDGTVTLAESDLFYTGGTLIFDHGHGISTLYMHMHEIFVKKGQKVEQGDIIGTVGSTGRATGPHLDVRLNWFDVRLDPATALDY